MIEERKKLNELHEKEITERTDEFEKIQNTLEQSIAQLTKNSKKDNVFSILNI
jgi:flagellar biosynthesis chaperone FliJ